MWKNLKLSVYSFTKLRLKMGYFSVLFFIWGTVLNIIDNDFCHEKPSKFETKIYNHIECSGSFWIYKLICLYLLFTFRIPVLWGPCTPQARAPGVEHLVWWWWKISAQIPIAHLLFGKIYNARFEMSIFFSRPDICWLKNTLYSVINNIIKALWEQSLKRWVYVFAFSLAA